MVAGVAALVAVATMLFYGVLTGGAGDSLTAEQPLEEPSGPISTAMTLMNGGDTLSAAPIGEAVSLPDTGPSLPDRGAFRAIFVASLVASCDHLVDGPEPIPAGLHREHGRCLNLALEGVDERCRLAADFFYVRPGDEALDIACDITGERSPNFRDSVRQSMVLQCDEARSDRAEQTHEAYYEYDRCLQMIDLQLDETCYLVARAQFLEQIESMLRTACEIDADIDLSAISGDLSAISG